jgi:hypothetical protein
MGHGVASLSVVAGVSWPVETTVRAIADSFWPE